MTTSAAQAMHAIPKRPQPAVLWFAALLLCCRATVLVQCTTCAAALQPSRDAVRGRGSRARDRPMFCDALPRCGGY